MNYCFEDLTDMSGFAEDLQRVCQLAEKFCRIAHVLKGYTVDELCDTKEGRIVLSVEVLQRTEDYHIYAIHTFLLVLIQNIVHT